MSYSTAELVVIALVMTFGSVVQGAVGFASGLLGVPLLVLYGFPLLDATVINFVSTSVQNLAGAVHLRAHLGVRDVFWPAAYRVAGLPIGLYALQASAGLSAGRVQQTLGVILLTSVALLGGSHKQPRENFPPLGTLAVFLSSGFLMGFASIGGAPMVFYVNSLTWSAAKSRGFLFVCSSLLMPLMAVGLIWRFGELIVAPAVAAVAVMPAGVAGLVVGLKLGARLDKKRFRRLTYGLLVIVALAAIASPLLPGR